MVAISCLCYSLSWAGDVSFPKKQFSESKIKKYSTKELLQYLSLNSINWQYEKYQNDIRFVIRDELVRRKQITLLIKAFKVRVPLAHKRRLGASQGGGTDFPDRPD